MQSKYSRRKKMAQLRTYLEQREIKLKKIKEVQRRRAVAKKYIWRVSVSALIAAMIVVAAYL